MENASKALIIAGAILISILLISIGIIIMNAVSEPVGSATDVTKSQAVQTFNAQFTTYEGPDVDFNTAKQCMTAVKSTKGTHTITLYGITSPAELKRNSTYSIVFTSETNQEGYYDKCTISENGTATTPTSGS